MYPCSCRDCNGIVNKLWWSGLDSDPLCMACQRAGCKSGKECKRKTHYHIERQRCLHRKVPSG